MAEKQGLVPSILEARRSCATFLLRERERDIYIRAREAGVWGLGMAGHVLIIGWIT